MVEFALVFPIFALVMFALISFGIYVYSANALNQATREGARYGSVASWAAECPTGSPLTLDACVRAVVRGRLTGVDTANTTVTVECRAFDPSTGSVGATTSPASCASGSTLRVTATAPVRLPGLTLSASGTTEMTMN
jgi:Flp pilus assembly protein TadG